MVNMKRLHRRFYLLMHGMNHVDLEDDRDEYEINIGYSM